MKKLILLSLIMAGMVLMAGFSTPARSQGPAHDEKPTFYRLTPGTYVNGWPRFTMTYPKDWIEQPPLPMKMFRAAPSGPPPQPFFAVTLAPTPLPLDKLATLPMLFAKAMNKDATLVSDKPSQLKDGTPAREIEIQSPHSDGIPGAWLIVSTKKGDTMIQTSVVKTGKIGEDLKAILYPLQYEPGRDEPLKVSPDVREFLDKFSSDMVSHDLTKVMAHYSDRYLESGGKKGEVERLVKEFIGSVTSFEIGITDFEAAGDIVYLAGFMNRSGERWQLRETSIIKENGEWKW
jgi:hypothetical protein